MCCFAIPEKRIRRNEADGRGAACEPQNGPLGYSLSLERAETGDEQTVKNTSSQKYSTQAKCVNSVKGVRERDR